MTSASGSPGKVQKSAADMKQDRAARAAGVKGRWAELRDSWDGHVATARQDRADTKADHDADHADHRADRAEDSTAMTGIAFLVGAILHGVA